MAPAHVVVEPTREVEEPAAEIAVSEAEQLKSYCLKVVGVAFATFISAFLYNKVFPREAPIRDIDLLTGRIMRQDHSLL